VTLHDGREVRIVVRFGEPSPPEALPNSADVILHALGDDLDDAVAVAEALQDVLLLGEATQRQYAEAAANLDETVAAVEVAARPSASGEAAVPRREGPGGLARRVPRAGRGPWSWAAR
jgi:hypothetical protein